MTELLLVRHGETSWNVERRLQGHRDIALNTTGLEQAQAVAAALKNVTIDAIICSDLQRAQQTAQAIAQYHRLTCQILPGLRERNFGGFEGHLIAELNDLFPSHYAAWRAHAVDSQFPANETGEFSGESVRQFHQRIAAAFLTLAHQYPKQTIVVVAHGGVLECAYRIARQLSLDAPREVSMLNASINRFELQATAQGLKMNLIEWGDVRHLEKSLDEV